VCSSDLNQGQGAIKSNREVVLIGHAGHPEVEGTIGRIPGKTYLVANVEDVLNLEVTGTGELSYLTQTTLSVDDTSDSN